MRGFLLIGAGIGGLIAASFLPQVQDYRDEKAAEHFSQGELKSAKWLYFLGKLQGDTKSANNYHVINYRLVRDDTGVSEKRLLSTRRKAFLAFDKLTQKGYVSAAYNAGMFYYRSSANNPNYEKGLMYFDYAAGNGDDMSRDAAGLMRARQFKKAEKNKALRESADEGNGLAAYQYANNLRFDKKDLQRAQKYAVQGAEAGYADAQDFLGSYFPKRQDAADWLEKAATNPVNRSLTAAADLAERADKTRDYKAKRHWLTVGSQPREKFKYRIVDGPDGLRWRGLQSSIMADINNSKSAAYDLAIMQMEGIGGPVDIEGAIENLDYADQWADAKLLLSQLKSNGAAGPKDNASQTSQGKTSGRPANLDLAKFDTHKNYPFYEKLRPYVANKQIRYATQIDLNKFKNGVSTRFTNEKKGFRKSGDADSCNLGYTCFYMEKPIILPADMAGAHAATFLVSPALFLPKQNSGHNRYIFVNERYVP